MDIKITKNKNSWINQNQELLLQYKDNWIAYNNRQGIIAFGKQLDEVIKQAEAVTDDFTVWHVSRHYGQPRAFAVRMAKKMFIPFGMMGITGCLNTLLYYRAHQKK